MNEEDCKFMKIMVLPSIWGAHRSFELFYQRLRILHQLFQAFNKEAEMP